MTNNTPERDLVLRWFEARAEKELAADELNKAREVLKLAEAKLVNLEQLLLKVTPDKDARRFVIRASGSYA